jgi:hypothetical protein
VLAREIDYRSIRLVLEKATGASPLKRQNAIRKLEKAYRRGELHLVPDEPPNARWARCQARFYLGDYSDWSGWEFQSDYHRALWYWKDSNPFPIPRWDGSRVKKLWIIGDQGIGDEVFFASCIPDVQKLVDSVVIECDPRLQGIFARSFGCEVRPAQIEGDTRKVQEPPEGAEAWWPIGDLARNFRRDLRNFPGIPYLKADREQIERFAAYRGKVGISWRGAQGSERRIVESCSYALSLQYDLEWDEIAPDAPGGLDLRNDIEGVLGLLSNLSKVVSVSTSVAHFAGALGVPVDVIIADPMTALPDRRSILGWKWVCKATPGRTPWYSSVRVFDNWKQYQSSDMDKAR